MKTLIIEDDAETATFIAAGLQSRGHEPRLAADGREGFELAAQETFDVIILDRMLPGLDGLSVVALLRAEGVSTPVLFLTNLSGVDDRVEGLGAGGDDYLVKPFAFRSCWRASMRRRGVRPLVARPPGSPRATLKLISSRAR
jgi:two-component system OmpR family response regulator